MKPVENPATERSLRESLHGKIDRMSQLGLSKLDQIIRQWELEELGEKLDDAFDRDRQADKLRDAAVNEGIAEHRKQHPYDA